MLRAIRFGAAAVTIAAASVVIQAQIGPPSASADIQLQLGHQLVNEARYTDGIQAFERAIAASSDAAREARAAIVQAALRIALFDVARTQAEALIQVAPRDPLALALLGDALWAAGLFEESEDRYREALTLAPQNARARHGLARSLAARSQLSEALAEAQAAVRLAPRDSEIHHTIGSIYVRLRNFEEAASAYSNFINLLPNRDRSQQAQWARSEVAFLRAFAQRVPFDTPAETDDQIHTVDFRVVNEKVVIRARINGGPLQDFVVDTGAEHTVLSRPTAQRLGIKPISTTLGSGVGEVGFRSLQMGRLESLEIGSLKIANLPCIIKDPMLRNLPAREGESLSPLPLGFSMIIDYQTRKLTMARSLPMEPSDFELPLRMQRLAVVRGTVDGDYPTNFVVDTGGQVISISKATATQLGRPEPTRRIALRVYGSSGWDRDAFLMPGVDLQFDDIRYPKYSVVVLNLHAPSALLGFQLGGTVGHSFLSKYRVAIDLERSALRLKANES
jgi:Flp pilus assembly protein TadD/predicted aspartyl protease